MVTVYNIPDADDIHIWELKMKKTDIKELMKDADDWADRKYGV